MDNLKKMMEQIDKTLNEKHATYIDLHKSLDEHRGKDLDDTDMQKVAQIIQDIQTTFADIYNVLHFVMFRHQFAQTATREYNEFIDQLKEHMIVKEDNEAEA